MFRLNALQALNNLVNAKLRSFLAVLGILVGTAAVVALVLLGQIATQKALAQFKSLGTDLLSFTLFEPGASGDGKKSTAGLSLSQVYAFKSTIPDINDVAPYVTLFQEVGFMGKKISATIVGAEEGLSRVLDIHLEEGNFISSLNEYEHYCVVGHDTANELRRLYGKSIINQQIWLGDSIYTIIGVMKPWTQTPFFNQDINKSVMIPIRGTALLNSAALIDNVVIRLAPKSEIDKVVANLTLFTKQNFPDAKVFTRSAREIIKSMQAQGQIFTLLLGFIGGISLFVGGIGVMNVMLVSVTERRREIGIRKAIGAKRRDILTLFLMESVVLGLFGGTLGVVVGLLTVMLIGYFTGWGFQFYWMPPLIGFIVSTATGIFFGFYPAHRASKLDPIETLRHE